jgi:hydrogenase maturation protease
MLGDLPEDLVLVGVQAGELDNWGGSLTEAVDAQLDAALELGLKELERWGHVFTPRADGAAQIARPLSRGSYERRPSEKTGV